MLARALQLLCPQRVRVIHVNHQLQVPAAEWANQVQQQCLQWQLPCTIHTVSVAAGNLEQEARRARYQALFNDVQNHEVLVLGHHQQDQAETVFLRLMAGSGVAGLAAMKPYEQRATVAMCRPLLGCSREQITSLAELLCPAFIDDPANQDVHFDRVMLRQQIWPILKTRWPAFQANITRTALLMQDTASILQDVLQQDWQQVVAEGKVQIDLLLGLSEARQRWLLSRWIQGHEVYAPALQQVELVRTQIILARDDASPKIDWKGWQLRRYRGELYRLPQQLLQAQPVQVTVPLAQKMQLPSGNWVLGTQAWGFPEALCRKTWHLKPREGGESLHLRGRVGHWPLKKSLQAAQLAPWQREQVHLLWIDGQVCGVFTAQGFWPTMQAEWVQNGYLPRRLSSTDVPDGI